MNKHLFRTSMLFILSMFLVTAIMAGGVYAQPEIIEDFESYAPESAIDGQGDWVSNNQERTKVVVDPTNPDNQVLACTNNFECYRPLTIASNDDSKVLRFRVMLQGPSNTNFNITAGLSSNAAPSGWGIFAIYAVRAATSGNLTTRQDPAGASGTWPVIRANVELDRWIQVEVHIQNSTNTSDIYLDGELVFENTGKRTVGDGAINTFYIKSTGDTTGIFYIDDILYPDPLQAAEPVPADNADDIPYFGNELSWAAGEGATKRNVYFGLSYDDVNDATVANPLGVLLKTDYTETAVDIEGDLAFGTDYFWRVDEANDVRVSKGDVWKFTVETESVTITDIVATSSSSSDPNLTGPQNTVNGSGLSNGLHDTASENMWFSNALDGLPVSIAFEFGQSYSLHDMMIWNYNTLQESLFGLGAKDASIAVADSNAGPWTPLNDVVLAGAAGAPDQPVTDVIDMQQVQASNVRLTINSNQKGQIAVTGLSEVQFSYLPVVPRDVAPADGAAVNDSAVTITWRGGRGAVEHHIYIDVNDNRALVEASDASVLAAVVPVDGPYGSHTVTGLNLSETYAWKVVAVNGDNQYASEVRTLMTPDFLVVDNMNGYVDKEPDEIWRTWLDGTEFGTDDPDNGSVVGANPINNEYGAGPGRMGGQSLPIWMNIYGTIAPYSEAVRKFEDDPRDWTSLKTLSLYVQCAEGYTGQLYVKINDAEVLYDGDADDLASGSWFVFNADLASANTNLADVKSLAVGVKGGGMGSLHVDDIRLYPLAQEKIVPVEPDLTAAAMAYYNFDGNANDSSGNGLNGTLTDASFVSPGATGSGSALLVQGTGYSDLGNPAKLDFSTGDWTVTGWYKTEMAGTGNANKGTIYGKGGDSGGGHRYALIMSETYEGRVSLVVDDDVNKRLADSPNITNDNEWHFVAGKREGDIIAIVVDGRIDDTAVLPEDYDYDLSGAVQYNAYVGALTDNSSKNLFKYFFGEIDEVRVFGRALSDAELAWMGGKRTPQHKPF